VRFLADENLALSMVEALRRLGHDVDWVRSDVPGSTDEQVLARAAADGRVLLTADKDFGELAFRSGLPAESGIILLRLRGSAEIRTTTLVAAIAARDDWAGQFAVVEHDRIRMTPLPRPSRGE
jgi:predicted nuclease of predicted toxin-antitoxin system